MIIATGGLMWTAMSAATDGDGETSPVSAQAAAHSTDPRVDNAWPVGEEWRYNASWVSPIRLNSTQYNLWQRGIQLCMTDVGFNYTPYAFIDSDAIYGRLNPLYETGLGLGYEEPDQLDPQASSLNAQQPEKFTDALLGQAGCADRSRLFVYGAPAAKELSNLQGNLIASVDRAISGYAASRDAREHAVAWSSCMKANDLNFATRDAIRDKFVDDGSVSGEEVQARRTDYECDLKSGLTESQSKWETEQFAAWSDKHAADIDEIDQSQSAAEREISISGATLTREGSQALPALEQHAGETTASTLPN